MKLHRRLIACILAVLLTATAALCVNAATTNLSLIGAKTGLETIGYSPDTDMLNEVEGDMPSSYRSDTLGLTLPVRNQNTNNCWAFGTLSSFETLLLANGFDTETFAPEHANYWGEERDDGTGWQRQHTDGGYSFIPMGYLTSWAGPINESDFPVGSSESEFDSLSVTPEYGLSKAVYFNNTNSINTIKALIYNYGSVVGNFHADVNKYLSDDRTSFYCNDHSYAANQLAGHCVSVVGWDDNYSRENFAGSDSGLPEKDGAWLIKNSWGKHYNSIGGYQWISYEDVWMFDEVFGPSYALTGFELAGSNTRLYQNEIDGATYQFDYLGQVGYDSVTYTNVFNFEEEHRNLDKIMFESTCVGADYTVYYIPMDGNAPTTEKSLWTKLSQGTVTYAGYHCADFEDVLLPKGKGAIGVRINSQKLDTLNSIGVCEWLSSGGNYIFIPQSEFGMSYYILNDSVRDVMSFYKSELRDDIGGTFVIKAITRNEIIPTEPPETTATETTDITESSDPTETTDITESSDPTETTDTTTATDATESIPDTSASVSESTEATVPDASSESSDATEESTTALSTTAPTTSIPSTTIIPTTDTTAESTAVPTTLTTSETADTTFDVSEPFNYRLGDADLNGKINVKDATYIQKHSADLIVMSERERMAADSNENGIVNVVDATAVQKFVAGLSIRQNVGKFFTHFF